MATPVELDPVGETLWRETLAAWDDQARHDGFVQHCFARGCLAAAGGRYRTYLDLHPGDETGRRMQERVVFLSLQALAASPASRSAPRPLLASPWFVVVILCGAVVGALLGIVYGGAR